MKLNNEQFIKAMNEQYIQNKRIEFALEAPRLAAEARNEEIANEAVDAYTLELMEEGVI